MKKALFQARQGDVFIQQVAGDFEIPKEAKPVPQDAGRTVLAYGEVTGHAHAFGGKKQPLLFRAGDDAMVGYMVIEGLPCTLKHEEHAPIEVPPGKYIVRGQREYSPQEIRRVAD